MTIRITILGCGSSGGVPRIGNDWGNCNPANPKNTRKRCSILISKMGSSGRTTDVLVDTSPDIRTQINQHTSIQSVDGVLFTHPHADHIHGIDDLRAFAINNGERVNVWADDPTSRMLTKRFSYCFKTPEGSDYPPILNLHHIAAGHPISIIGAGGQIDILPFTVNHGRIDSLGFKVNNAAYIPDVNGIPEESLVQLSNLDHWIIDALRRSPHPSHFCLSETLEWIRKIKPRQAYLTNMHIDLDYDFVAENTPNNVVPCHDGMIIDI